MKKMFLFFLSLKKTPIHGGDFQMISHDITNHCQVEDADDQSTACHLCHEAGLCSRAAAGRFSSNCNLKASLGRATLMSYAHRFWFECIINMGRIVRDHLVDMVFKLSLVAVFK